MIQTYLLPDPGEGLEEAEIVAWRVAEGDTIAVNDVIVEVETSKSIVELPSPFAGVVKRLLVAEGTMVDVGSAIVEVDDLQGGSEPTPTPTQTDTVAEPEGANLVGYGPKASPSRRRRTPRAQDDPVPLGSVFGANVPSRRADEVTIPGQVVSEATGDPLPDPGKPPMESALVLASGPNPELAKPPVRKYAKDLGVDLTMVTGTGPNGTITRADVEAAAAFQALGAQQGRVINDQATFGAGHSEYSGPPRGETRPGEHRVPIKGVRKVTAANMKRSVSTHVHVTEWTQVDVTATMELVETLKSRREFAGLRISPLLVYAKAICLALQRNPDLNTSWDEANQEIVYYEDVNLGIAAATPRGLMVPNIKGAQRLSMLQLSQAINRLVTTSREGKLQPTDYAQGTFTVTNVGVFGIDAGTPIINGDESAILCMGSIERRPWVVNRNGEERIEPRWVTTLAVSFDHRHIDGEQGSSFLHDVAEILSEPSLAMLF